MKGYGDLSGLDFSKSGIPKTSTNKNRQATLIINRKDYNLEQITNQLSDLLTDLLEDTIDTIVIDVKDRTWIR